MGQCLDEAGFNHPPLVSLVYSYVSIRLLSVACGVWLRRLRSASRFAVCARIEMLGRCLCIFCWLLVVGVCVSVCVSPGVLVFELRLC